MKQRPRRRSALFPMLWIAAAFALGIAATAVVEAAVAPLIAAASAAALAAAFLQSSRYSALLILIGFFLAGGSVGIIERESVADTRLRAMYDSGRIASGTPVVIEAVVASQIEPAPDGAYITAEADRLTRRGEDLAVTGRVRMFVPNGEAATDGERRLRYGSRVRVACLAEREDKYLDPGVVPTRRMLDALGIDAVCTLKSRLLLEHIADESVPLPRLAIYEIRENIIDTFRRRLDTRSAGVMSAVMLGDRYFLDKVTAELFREGGTFHILVISGLHITFIGGIFLVAMRAVTRVRWLQFAVSVTALWAYTLAVGANLPAVRASLMFTTAMLGYVLYRSSSLLNTLGVSAIILLVWRPADVFDASFHLTFASVGVIVGLAIPLLDKLKKIGEWTPSSSTPLPPNVRPWLRRACETIYWVPEKWAYEASTNIWSGHIVKRPYFNGRLVGTPQKAVRYLIESVVVSAIAQAAMLPLSIIYFNRVTVSSIVLNIWVSIFITLQAAAAVGGVVLSLVADVLGDPLFAVAGWLNVLMLALPKAMSELCLTGWRLPAYTGGGTAVYIVFLVMLAGLAALTIQWEPFERGSKQPRRRMFKMLISGLAIMALIMVTHPFIRTAGNGELRVSFLDVGQGDAILIELPKGGTVLVDGGGRRSYRSPDEDGAEFEPDFRGIGEAVTNQVLWSRGISKIDFVAVTHADADHAQGLVDVAGAIPFNTLLMGRDACSNAEIEPLCSIAKGRGSSIDVMSAGSSFELEGVTFEVLGPLSPDGVYDNDASLVLRLTFGDRSFLLTGDVERLGEALLVGSGLGLAADVVKIPHHGSKTSSTPGFVAAVNARYAVVSAGRRSQFGHPHAEVITRWQSAGAAVLSTQDNGMITFVTNGESIAVETFVRW